MNSQNANLFSFRVSNIFIPRFLNILEVTPDFPLTEQVSCPADETVLKTLCTLIGNGGAPRIRIGCCPTCGYVGYIDRPAEDWIKSYYSDTWDHADKKNIEAEAAQQKARPGKLERLGMTAEQFEQLGVDKNCFILEIGSGIDRIPKGLQQIGYTKIVAVDNSKHRAQISSKAFGIKVLPYPFEHTEAQAQLKKFSPFSLIFSSHVLEHTHNPALIIRLCASLQKEGDYLIFTLPNMVKETVGIIFFISTPSS